MIRITSLQNGFRRAGIAHAATPTEYSDDRFTEEQLATLKSEKMLLVEIVEDGEGAPTRLNAKETVALVKEAADIESLNVLGEGEERTSVLDAIEKRRKELETPPAQGGNQ